MVAVYHYPLPSYSGQEVAAWCDAVAAGVSYSYPRQREKASADKESGNIY